MHSGGRKRVSEFQFIIRFRKERRAPAHGQDVWRGPEEQWAQRWVKGIDEVPDAMRALLASIGLPALGTDT